MVQVIRPTPFGDEGWPMTSVKGPVATLACVGAVSCGWSLGLWFEAAFVREMIGRWKERAA